MSGLGTGNRQERRALMAITNKTMKNRGWGEWEHRFTPENAAQSSHLPGFCNGWCNNVFAVQEFVVPGAFNRVMVRKHNSSRVEWAELQRIKNELFGDERMAFEMLPRQSDLVDSANMYWFFLVPNYEEKAFDVFTNNNGAASK